MHTQQLRTIKTTPGIGDFLFFASKLLSTGERFNFQISDGKPQRGKQIFDLLPAVSASCTYTPNLGYKKIKEENIQRVKPLWKDIDEQEFFLCANRHLELGHRIEEFLPDLPTSFRLDYATTEEDKETARRLTLPNRKWFTQKPLNSIADDIEAMANGLYKIHTTENVKYVGIYSSAYSSQRNWGFWTERGWFDFIKLFHKENPELVFVIIGASFDVDLSGNLMKLLKAAKIPYVDTIGQPLSVVIEVLKRLSYFVGFPSGLSILNETLGKSTFMFYPEHLQLMQNAWADPVRIESGEYKGAQFCTPEKAFRWIKNEHKLFNKI